MFVSVAPFHLYFSVLIEMVIEIVLSSYENSNISTFLDRKMSNLKYPDDVVLLGEVPIELHVSP